MAHEPGPLKGVLEQMFVDGFQVGFVKSFGYVELARYNLKTSLLDKEVLEFTQL